MHPVAIGGSHHGKMTLNGMETIMMLLSTFLCLHFGGTSTALAVPLIPLKIRGNVPKLGVIFHNFFSISNNFCIDFSSILVLL